MFFFVPIFESCVCVPRRIVNVLRDSFSFYILFWVFGFLFRLDTMGSNSWISVFIASAMVLQNARAIFIGGEQDVGSPLRVAQCRATCLERVSTFSPKTKSTQNWKSFNLKLFHIEVNTIFVSFFGNSIGIGHFN